ncbi:MAG: tRNA (adenosine(37)-N6)-threonylcarbamoyltransferase complex dimerization subunit type 1 TsaB [Azoarcus sp.]|nr:tRNA (adenosine(37)-N6)-threonylcarbamoyltransferase complex dimerization subunit type 1 TsaB [Azoarcus sp.]
MNLLALETSCEHASVALYMDGDLREQQLEGHANHSENILSVIRQLLAEGGIGVDRLDAVSFGSGPGAFTGLRLSCGIAQGLALGAGLGVVPVCSLDALAMQASSANVFAATDARMGEVYFRTCVIENGLARPLTEAGCAAPDVLDLPDGQWWGIGSAFKAYGERLSERFRDRLLGSDPQAVPRARDVVLLAVEQVRLGKVLPADLAVPLYVRDKVALTTAERLARGGKA